MVSVIIPTYNRARFLLQAVESVRRQTYEDWELIVVDDGSTESTAAVLKSQAFSDPRIRYVSQSHSGVSSARNHGLQMARHPWIAFLDSDDLWRPNKLERQVEALKPATHLRIAHTDEIWIRGERRVNPKKIHRKHGGWIYRYCLARCVVSPSSVLIHRSIFDQEGLFDESYPVCEDYELWLRLCCRLPVLLLRDPLTVKRGGHADQLSRSTWGLDRYRLQALLKTWKSGRLTHQQKVWTAREIALKVSILAQGCEKRGKMEEARCYRELDQRTTS